MCGKEDPAFKIAEANDRSKKGASDFVWALKDIDFEVSRGEVLGIIGKNGAGKSTLLKILSRVAAPTTGRLKMKGRIASLLEVGTGFHPDLSGRENIFLNGTILGMTKNEIKRSFDEIVEFSGVERYLDTPVKRYSSGMYVRLAFAVAAHLEPEILIVDEVLAVGDHEFQKRCMGKMKSVQGQGKTILFVSHNMSAIQTLCSRAIFIEHGKIVENGPTRLIIDKYMVRESAEVCLSRKWDRTAAPGNEHIRLRSARVVNDQPAGKIFRDTPFEVELRFELHNTDHLFYVGMHFNNMYEEPAFVTAATPVQPQKGLYVARVKVPANLLNSKLYTLTTYFVNNHHNVLHKEENMLTFEVADLPRGPGEFTGEYSGNVRPRLEWQLEKIGES